MRKLKYHACMVTHTTFISIIARQPMSYNAMLVKMIFIHLLFMELTKIITSILLSTPGTIQSVS